MIFLDTETCGLVGPIVLIQYQENDGPIILHEVWKSPVYNTLELIYKLISNELVIFNAAFDWFHLVKLYNLLIKVEDEKQLPDIEEIVRISEKLRSSNNLKCLKPKGILDLMLYIKRSSWQTLMDRRDVTITRVPFEVAGLIADELEQRLDIPAIYFAKRSGGYEWIVEPCEDYPGFCDIKLKFGASYGLKPLCAEIFKIQTQNYPVPKQYLPVEYSYDPYDTNWYKVINYHIEFWSRDRTARSYAEQDIILLHRLYTYFGNPPMNDVDSKLAICVGAVRFAGFNIDIEGMINRVIHNANFLRTVSVNYNSSMDVKKYLLEEAKPEWKILIQDTSKQTLKALCKPVFGEVARRAEQVLKARTLDKENNTLEKLIKTTKFCPDLKVIGTRSGRMSGGAEEGTLESINPQGISRDNLYRQLFTLKDSWCMLSGGDFESFEVCLADAAYNDEHLRADLQSGKKFHALFGQILYDTEYDEIMGSKGTTHDLYTPAKNSVFALFYGAHTSKLAQTAGITEEKAQESYEEFITKYPKVGVARAIIFDAFCSMRQPNGIGSAIIWKEPADYIESLLGFKRFFTLENQIVKTVFELANSLPSNISGTRQVTRNKRVQTIRGSTQSALYAAAFRLQAANMRAAANHVIQSTGGEITKAVEAAIWDLQPQGAVWFMVKLLNEHDEIMCVHTRDMYPVIERVVQEKVETYRSLVPLINMKWKTNLKSWGEK